MLYDAPNAAEERGKAMSESHQIECWVAPRGELFLRTIAMPGDANPAGDVFGGWLLSQMDLAAGSYAAQRARGRAATIAIDAMKFHHPVLIGDEVSCYVDVIKVGRTSISVMVEAWARRRQDWESVKVTEGRFTFVAIDEHRHPRPVDAEPA